VKRRKKTLGRRNKEKDYFCTVVSEYVVIALRNKASYSFGANRELFVKCNQSECQYVDLNQPPCPLHLDLFAEEIKKREQKRSDKRMGF
jgi:hypothetical protein